MALDYYGKTCGKNVAGNHRKVFFGAVTDTTAVTVSSTPFEISAITNSTKFKAFTAEIDTVEFKSDSVGKSNIFYTETLTMKFANKTKTLVAALETLKDQVTCGIAAIFVDGNGIGWLAGYDARATDPTSRPFNKLKISFDSGSKPSDVEGNMVTVELTRESEWKSLPIDSTLSPLILSESGAALNFIAVA